jgi:hypothetical protein
MERFMSGRRRRMLPIDATHLAEMEAEQRRRRLSQVEAMVADLDRRAAELDREIAAEQKLAGIHDPAHYAYPTYARSAMIRRDNLRRSAAALRAQLHESAFVAEGTVYDSVSTAA